MCNRFAPYVLKSAFAVAILFAMSSSSQAGWYWYWGYPTYGPGYYTTSYAPACSSCCGSACSSCSSCSSCGVGCTTCRVGCAPCGTACNACSCAPCNCTSCDCGSCSVTSAEPVPEAAPVSRVDGPTLAPAPLDLDEVDVAVRVAPTRQRIHVEAHYRVPHVARLDVEPTPASDGRSILDSRTYMVSR